MIYFFLIGIVFAFANSFATIRLERTLAKKNPILGLILPLLFLTICITILLFTWFHDYFPYYSNAQEYWMSVMSQSNYYTPESFAIPLTFVITYLTIHTSALFRIYNTEKHTSKK